MDPSCIDHLAFAVILPHCGLRVMHLLLISQIVLQKILTQLRPEAHDGRGIPLELLDPLGEFRRMFRRERCVMLLHLAAPAGEHGGEAGTAYNESEAETASLVVFVAK